MVYIVYIIDTGFGYKNESIKKIEAVFNTKDMAHLYVYRQEGSLIYENYETCKSFWKLQKGVNENLQYVIEGFELGD